MTNHTNLDERGSRADERISDERILGCFAWKGESVKRSRFVSLLFVVSVAPHRWNPRALICSAIRSSAQSYQSQHTEFWDRIATDRYRQSYSPYYDLVIAPFETPPPIFHALFFFIVIASSSFLPCVVVIIIVIVIFNIRFHAPSCRGCFGVALCAAVSSAVAFLHSIRVLWC